MSTALRCPRLFHFRYVDKLPEPEVMPEARIGKAIHVALEHALQGTPPADAAAKARADLTDEHELHRYDALTAGVAPFTERIYSAYHEASPLTDGWRERIGLHQLHILIVHAALFGGSYGAQTLATARKYV